MARTNPTAILLSLMAFGAVAMSACTPWATYPPIEGARNIGSPAAEPVPRLMAESILYTNERFLSADESEMIVYNLPEGATTKLYADAGRWMTNARPMVTGDANAIHVTEVRLRAMDAQVDVIYPRGATHNEFVTLYFKKDIVNGWRVTDSRLWRVRQGAPQPTHEIAMEIEAAERAAEAADEDATVSAPTDSAQQP
jgi:hypothetical protein